MTLFYQTMKTPVGELSLVADSKSVRCIVFRSSWKYYKNRFVDLVKIENTVLLKTKKQLKEYFQGTRRHFSIPYLLEGTKFQIKVWKSLEKIPFGETKSYKDQAKNIKSPKAVRAVGRTNGLNPLCIILPCHRVIGSDGSLTGYAGGLKIKQLLLKHEAKELK